MKLFKTLLVVTAALVTAVIAVPLAQAGTPTPAERALEIRSQGMSQLCSNPTLSREAYRAVCGDAGAANQPTRAELHALHVRGEAMNHLCDKNQLASAEASAALCGSQPVAASQIVPVEAASRFDWTDFGIGAGAMLGLVLLAGGILLGVHYGRRGSARPRPVS